MTPHRAIARMRRAIALGLAGYPAALPGSMKTTFHFDNDTLRDRPYMSLALCIEALNNQIYREEQADGRIRIWGMATVPGESRQRILRVVLLEDGETVHTAFIDSGFGRWSIR